MPNRDHHVAATTCVATRETATAAWRALAPLMAPAGRRVVRLIDPESKQSVRRAKITDRLPALLAAVPLFNSVGRTTLLAFDFDAKRGGRGQVDTDVATAIAWLTACGARIVTDHSTSGGRHILVPLAAGTTASFTELKTLVQALAARLPSLDIAPNLNSRTGAISVPGTVCSGGGYRVLDGPLADAIDAFTTGSDPAFLPAMYAFLGTLPAPPAGSNESVPAPLAPSVATTGEGDNQRLAAAFCWRKPLRDDVAEFASSGVLPAKRRWKTPSEARMSVLLTVVKSGYTLTAIRANMRPGRPWEGLGRSYAEKDPTNPDRRLIHDFRKALAYCQAPYLDEANQRAHRNKYTHPPEGVVLWLSHSLAWADREFRGSKHRWAVRDVLQALAVKAVAAGREVAGVFLVDVGGRSLSLSAGLLSATATFDVLRRLREMPGAPILLTRRGVGRDADCYALTISRSEPVTPTPRHRVRVEDVHPVWSVLGRSNRVVYELVAHTGLASTQDVAAAAQIGVRSAQLALAALAQVGLIERAGNTLRAGQANLDDLAGRLGIGEAMAERIQRYRAERADWWTWLERQAQIRAAEQETPADPMDPEDRADYLDTVGRRRPPPADEEELALDLLRETLGARIIVTEARAPVGAGV